MEDNELIKMIFSDSGYDAWHGQQLSVMMEAIKSHLEFLGYEVTVRRDSTILRATHPHKRDFSFYEADGIVRLMEITVGRNRDETPRSEFLEFVNRANNGTWLAHFSLDEQLNITAHTSYVEPYYKPLFGRLLERWNSDLLSLHEWEDSSTYLHNAYTTSQIKY